MNADTVLKCARMAADMRKVALGQVDQDILDLIAELEAPVQEAPAPEADDKAE